MTPPEGVNAQEWAVDRAFYINCRMEQIKVDRLLVRTALALTSNFPTANLPCDASKMSSLDSKLT